MPDPEGQDPKQLRAEAEALLQRLTQSEEKRSEAEIIGRIIQSEQKLTDYFTTVISKTVLEQIEEKNSSRLRVFSIVAIILVSVIIPAVGVTVRGLIADQTESALNERLTASVESLERNIEIRLDRLENRMQADLDALKGGLQKDIEDLRANLQGDFKALRNNLQSRLNQEAAYAIFTSNVLSLSQRTDVSKRETQALAERVRAISQDPELTSRAEFPFLFDLVVRVAIENRARDLLATLESELPDYIASSATTLFRLARYYGEQIAGDHFSIEARREAAEAFQHYMERVYDEDGFEELIPLHLLVTRISGARDEQIQTIQRRALDLDPEGRATVIYHTVRYTNPRFWTAAHAAGDNHILFERDYGAAKNKRIAAAAGQLVDDNRVFFATLLKEPAVRAELDQLARREANLGNKLFSDSLLAFNQVFRWSTALRESPAFIARVRAFVRADMEPWLDQRIIIGAIELQNREKQGYSQDQFAELDRQWRDEIASSVFDLVEKTLKKPISRYLRQVRNTAGLYHQIVVMDTSGLVVGMTDPVTAYWQQDNPVRREMAEAGSEALYVGEIRFSESNFSWEIPIALPITDSEQARPIGTIEMRVDPVALI